MPTIKDVAKRANVSPGTVSRYLNGYDIKEKNRIKIEEAIHSLGFQRNLIARGLRTNKTNTIGVIVRNLSDVYESTIVKAIEQRLYECGYNILVCSSNNSPDLEKQKINMLANKIVDGIIIDPCSQSLPSFELYQEREIPIVTIDLQFNNWICDQVLTDNINATFAAVEYLFHNGHERIGIITGYESIFTARERLAGYVNAYERYGLPLRHELIRKTSFSEKAGYQSLLELMDIKSPPTAVITCNYNTTIGAIKAIYTMNIKVPDTLSFIGFDNIGLSEIVQPPITIVMQPMREIGKAAADLVLRRVNGDRKGFPTLLRLGTELIIRQSVKNLQSI